MEPTVFQTVAVAARQHWRELPDRSVSLLAHRDGSGGLQSPAVLVERAVFVCVDVLVS